MAHYVALIRGVAPSTPPRNNACILPVIESLGFAPVLSVLSSGNYVFAAEACDTNELQSRIEAALLQQLGASLMTIVRSQAQIETIIDQSPLREVPHKRGSYQLVTFFKEPVELGFELPYQLEGKFCQLVGCVDGALFTLTDNSAHHTVDVMGWLERHYTHDLTSRTPLTLQKILNKMQDLGLALFLPRSYATERWFSLGGGVSHGTIVRRGSVLRPPSGRVIKWNTTLKGKKDRSSFLR